MKKILLALSLLYLAFCGELACLDQAKPSQASDCLQRTPSSKNSVCCYVEGSAVILKYKMCAEATKGFSSDQIKEQLKKEIEKQYSSLITLEDFKCSGSYLKIGLLLLTAFLL